MPIASPCRRRLPRRAARAALGARAAGIALVAGAAAALVVTPASAAHDPIGDPTRAAAGRYPTSFRPDAVGRPTNDFVADRVASGRAATGAIPAPEAWMLMLSGVAFAGTFLRRGHVAARRPA